MLLLRRRAASRTMLLQLLWFMAAEGESLWIPCLEGGWSKRLMSRLMEEVLGLLLLFLLTIIIITEQLGTQFFTSKLNAEARKITRVTVRPTQVLHREEKEEEEKERARSRKRGSLVLANQLFHIFIFKRPSVQCLLLAPTIDQLL